MKGALNSSSIIQTETSYGLVILYQCGKKIKTKSQTIFGVNSYICRSHRGKTGSGIGLMFPLQNRIQTNSHITYLCENEGNDGSTLHFFDQ